MCGAGMSHRGEPCHQPRGQCPGCTAMGTLPWGSPPTAAPLGLIRHCLSCTISTLSEFMDAECPVFILEALGKAPSKIITVQAFGGNMIKEMCFQRVSLGKKKISLWKVLTGLRARRILTSWTGELDPHLMPSHQIKFKQHSKGLKLV